MKKIYKKILTLVLSLCTLAGTTFFGGCSKDTTANGAWIVKEYAPTTTDGGNNGDMWLDTATYDIYQKTSEGWVSCGNIKGESGKPGTNGSTGKNGSSWLTGEGHPDIAGVEANANDMYLDLNGGKVFKMVNKNWTYVFTVGEKESNLADMPWYDDGALKILMVGNSFSVDTAHYLWKIANSLGIEEIIIGNLYVGGCTLEKHYTYARDDSASYDYYLTNNAMKGSYAVYKDYKYSTALASQDWDFISFQQASTNSGQPNTYARLPSIVEYYTSVCPDAQIVWNMTWAYDSHCTQSGFNNYGKNQIQMYNAILNAVEQRIVPDEAVDIISPTGAAIQNAREALGEIATRDGYHLYYYGSSSSDGTYDARYIAALTFLGKLTGMNLDRVSYSPYPSNATNKRLKAVSIDCAQKAILNVFNQK